MFWVRYLYLRFPLIHQWVLIDFLNLSKFKRVRLCINHELSNELTEITLLSSRWRFNSMAILYSPSPALSLFQPPLATSRWQPIRVGTELRLCVNHTYNRLGPLQILQLLSNHALAAITVTSWAALVERHRPQHHRASGRGDRRALRHHHPRHRGDGLIIHQS